MGNGEWEMGNEEWGEGMLDTGYRILDPGYGIRDAGYGMASEMGFLCQVFSDVGELLKFFPFNSQYK